MLDTQTGLGPSAETRVLKWSFISAETIQDGAGSPVWYHKIEGETPDLGDGR